MNNIAILGCGWLGLPLAEKLINLGYLVNGSSTSELKKNKLNKLGVNYFKIDLNNLEDNIKDFLAVDVLIISIPPKLLNHKKVLNNLISEIKSSTIKRVIYTSSISVYGNQTGTINEQNTLYPKSNSAIQIAQTEKILLTENKYTTTVLRLGGLIGNNRHPAYYLAGKKIAKPKDLINLIHLDDCIKIISNIINLNEASNQIYNLVNPIHPEKGEYYSECCRKLKLNLPLITNQEKFDTKIISSQKIIDDLGYRFKDNINLH